MYTMLLLLVLLPVLMLCFVGVLPTPTLNRRVEAIRRSVCWIAISQCVAALVALLVFISAGLRGDGRAVIELVPMVASFYLDGFSLLMLSLVSFVGVVVSCYSVRYLDGDPNQGSFFRWLSFTIAGVSCFVASGNLLMTCAAWGATSFGLHHLLVHYSGRRAAQDAAWTKFTISRIGDVLFVSAIALIYGTFGSLELASVFASLEQGVGAGSWSLWAMAWLLMLAAVAKSAQFPFHAWLPNTLEAPTPVSALMHAGIVNAGGYLIIRLSPIMVAAPTVLGVLAMIGSVTLGYAGMVMMTQTSVKRSLAYSTIAQMGFMMVQCGMGAFSAAMLHIIAHSLYKAYAFLNSGSVLTEAEGRRAPKPTDVRSISAVHYLGGSLLAFICVVLSARIFQVDFATKPGGLVIGFVLTMAITTWLWDVLRLKSMPSLVTGLLTAWALAMLYMTGYVAINQLVSASVPQVQPSFMQTIATTDVFVVISALLGLNLLLATKQGREMFSRLYVHAANGFYVDAWTRRLFSFSRY